MKITRKKDQKDQKSSRTISKAKKKTKNKPKKPLINTLITKCCFFVYFLLIAI